MFVLYQPHEQGLRSHVQAIQAQTLDAAPMGPTVTNVASSAGPIARQLSKPIEPPSSTEFCQRGARGDMQRCLYMLAQQAVRDGTEPDWAARAITAAPV